MSVVDAITITSVSTVNQITISNTSNIAVATVGTQGLAGPSTIMGKAVDVNNTAGASDNGAVLIYNNGTSTWTASTLNTSQSITQNIYNLRLNGANATVTAILDEDNMSSDSATSLATQQSIKKYVDDNNTVQDLDIVDDSGNQIDVRINNETLGLLGGTGISSVASGTGVTFNIDATVVTLTGTQTLTNKTLTSPALTTPVFNTSISGSAFLDEDDFASNSANKVASQQSIKAYVDAQVDTVDTLAEILAIGNTTGGTNIIASTTDRVQFRDANIYIYSSTDGTLDLKADGEIQLTAPYIDLAAANVNVDGTIDAVGVEFNTLSGTGSVTITDILDEDNMASNSATKLATQQSIKAYVDTQITAEDLDITDGSNSGAIDLDSEVLGILGGTGVTSTLSGNNITLAIDNTVTTLTGTQTLTNKTLTTPKLNGNIVITTTGTEVNVLDGDTSASSVVLVDADQFIVNDSGVMKQIAITRLDTYFSGTTKTLTNKTLTAPVVNNGVLNNAVLNTGLSGSAFLDEDDLSSNSATKVASQQSIKAYVDSNITAQDLDVTDGSTNIAIDLDSETLSLLGGTGIDSTASGNGVTFAIDNTVATLVGSQTLTNKSIDVDNNTVANIELDNLKSGVLDTDLSSVASTDTTIASAKAIKTYVDAQVTAQDLDISDGSSTIAIDLDSETLSLLGGTGVTSTASGNGVTLAIGQSVATGDDVVFNQVTAALVGNSSTATALQTARTIGGVSFNGTSNINLAGVNTAGNQNTSGNSATTTALATARTIGGTSFDGTANIAVGLSATATALATARTIGLSGDVTASGVSFDGTGNITLSTTIAANSVALGTDTTGNYVAAITGSSNEIEVTNSGGENRTVNIGLPDNVTISGNLTVNGTTTTTDTNELHVTDPLIKLAKDNTANSLDIGFYGQYRASGSTNQFAGLFRDQNDSGKFKLFELLQNEPTTTVNTSGTGYQAATLVATLEGNLTGNVTGNVSGTSATVTGAAQTNITSLGTLTALQVDNININGNTISSTAGTDLNITPLGGQQIVLDGAIIIDAGVVTGATSITSTDFVGDLTGDVTGNTSGNAGTATVLQTARTIGGTSFNGSANIEVALANTSTILATSRNFSVSGDITASAVAFNGSGNVVLSASIDDNVVGASQLNISGNGSVGQAILSDGDGSFSYGDASKTTEQIQDIVGGMVTSNTETGITVTYEDGDGTLDFVINPAQTTITSLLATDIKIGEDEQTKIDFGTADEIHFFAANANQIKLVDGALVPATDNDVDLGTSSAEFKNAFFDGTVTADAFAGPLTGAVTGNASTATILETARTIGGTSFDGSSNIAVALSATATALATARTIGGVSFDGTSNINLAGVNTTGNQDTSGNSATATALETSRTIGGTAFDGTANIVPNLSNTATTLATARTIGGTSFDGSADIAIALANTATTLATARTIGGVSFNGSANINLAGVNTTGNQDTSGNAATATALATARTIGGTSFNGTANISIALANTATTLATARTINGVSFNGSANITTLTAGTGVSVSGTAVSIGQAVATSSSPTFSNMTLSGTDSIKVPAGTTGQRNGSPANGMFRYNNTNEEFEGYQNGAWGAIAGGGAAAMETSNHTGNGSTRAFSISTNVVSEDNLVIFIDGVYQNKATFVASGTTVTFDTAPANTRKIVIYHVRSAVAGSSIIQDNFTGNGSTTAYTLSINPTSELNTQVYIDGVYQSKSTYAVSGTTLTFDTAPVNTTAIEVIIMSQTSVNVPTSNSVTTSMIQDANITTDKILNSNVTLAKMAANSVDSNQYVDGSIDTVHIADSQITSAKIADGTIVTADLANDSVDGSKLTNNIDIAGTLDVTGATTLDSTLSVSGNITGTLATAAQPNITSLGTLTALTGGTGDLNWDSGTLFVDSSANAVGIGTASPEGITSGVTSLSISDAGAKGDGDKNGVLAFKTDDASYTNTYSDGVTAEIHSISESGTGAAYGLGFVTGTITSSNRAERVRINATGSVGIGTASPTELLEVFSESASTAIEISAGKASTTTGEAKLVLRSLHSSSGTTYSRSEIASLGTAGGDSDLIFRTTTASSGPAEHMRITDDGKVGIGQTSPTDKLHIGTNSGGTQLKIQSASGNNNCILHTNGTTDSWRTGMNLTLTNGSYEFYDDVNNVSRMVLDSSGKVGIGIASPTSTLDVRGVFHVGASASTTPVISRSLAPAGSQGLFLTAGVVNGESTTTPTFADNSSSGASIFLAGNASDQYGGNLILKAYGAGSDGNNIILENRSGTNTFSERMRIDSDGDVGIGIAAPNGHKLHIYDGANSAENTAPLRIQGSGYSAYHWLNGTAYYIGQNSDGRHLRMYSGSNEGVGVYLSNGANSWSSYSDERLKENIQDIGSVTEKIKDIRCVTYNRKDVNDENKHETIGFIAQDFVGKFDQVLDESKVLDSDEETRYSIKYTETIPVLLKAIQEQQTLIESLTARITTLEG